MRVAVVSMVDGLQAAMPSFVEVPGTYEPVVAGAVGPNGVLARVPLTHPAVSSATVLVEVPEADLDDAGNPSTFAIKARYPNHFLVTNGYFK